MDGPGAAGVGTEHLVNRRSRWPSPSQAQWFHVLRHTDGPGLRNLSSSAPPETEFPTLNEAAFPWRDALFEQVWVSGGPCGGPPPSELCGKCVCPRARGGTQSRRAFRARWHHVSSRRTQSRPLPAGCTLTTPSLLPGTANVGAVGGSGAGRCASTLTCPPLLLKRRVCFLKGHGASRSGEKRDADRTGRFSVSPIPVLSPHLVAPASSPPPIPICNSQSQIIP